MLHCIMTPSSHSDPESSVPAPLDHVEDDQRSAPAQVYRSKVYPAKDVNDWIVEPPRDKVAAEGKTVFTGARAQHLALTYAYERFGNARFFPYSDGDR